jgi:aminoglycoside phosphotransferase (APT) family kinase protein
MHDDDFSIDEASARQLVAEHAPQWASLPLVRHASSGTDNAIFRLGENLVLRVPRRPSAVCLLSKNSIGCRISPVYRCKFLG